MFRLLHLLSPTADEQTRQIHALLVREFKIEFDIATQSIGRGGTYRHLPAAILRLRQQKPFITYAWGIPALAAAVLAKHPRIFFSPEVFAGPRALRWIRPMCERGNVTFICPTFTQQRIAVSGGIKPDHCIVIQPGVDFGAVRYRRDTALRAALGFAEDDFVLLAPGESIHATGHEQAVWTTGILHVLDPATKLLLWGRGSRSAAMIHLGNRLKQPALVTLAEQKLQRSVRYEELLSVADLCLATPAGASPMLPIATSMASGVPIVSTVTYMLAELLEDRHTALMVPRRSPRALTQRVLDLRADPTLRHTLTDTARAEAYEHFSMTRMLAEYRSQFTKAG